MKPQTWFIKFAFAIQFKLVGVHCPNTHPRPRRSLHSWPYFRSDLAGNFIESPSSPDAVNYELQVQDVEPAKLSNWQNLHTGVNGIWLAAQLTRRTRTLSAQKLPAWMGRGANHLVAIPSASMNGAEPRNGSPLGDT